MTQTVRKVVSPAFTPDPAPSHTRDLWAIGWMTFFLSTGTLMVEALLPTFLTEVLHVSHTKLGFLEGIAIAMAFATKILSGVLSDVFRARKPLIAIGNTFSLLVKLMFAAASTFSFIFLAKCIDRIAKGVRASPTDALIADLSRADSHGKSYGIRQTLYPLGAAFGSIIAAGLMIVTQNSYRTVFFLSVIPGIISLIILAFFIRQPKIRHEIPKATLEWSVKDVRFLPSRFWLFLGVSTILMFARFSAAFLLLRAKSVGWDIALLPLLLVGYEVIHAFVAYPIGALADKTNRKTMLFIGMGVLLVADIVLMGVVSRWGVLFGIILVGLHLGITQGLLSAMVAEATPADLRGTAFALYYFFSGGALLIGNVIAGHLSDTFGIYGTFGGGAIFTALAMAALAGVMKYDASKAK
jgi:MFS family permease